MTHASLRVNPANDEESLVDVKSELVNPANDEESLVDVKSAMVVNAKMQGCRW